MQTVLKIMEQRARLLGLHQPERTDAVTLLADDHAGSYRLHHRVDRSPVAAANTREVYRKLPPSVAFRGFVGRHDSGGRGSMLGQTASRCFTPT